MDGVRAQIRLPDDAPTGRGVKVAVLDTGFDDAHPDLQKAVDRSASSCCVRGESLIDRHYHGTHIAGIIAGDGTASGGRYRGIAPDATLLVVKISRNGGGVEGDVAAGIEAAISYGADIINYSASHSPLKQKGPPPWLWAPRSFLEDLFQEAASRGILCVIAAGNDGTSSPYRSPAPGSVNRPGGMEDALTVGNVDRNGRIAASSSRGPYSVSPVILPGKVERYDAALHREVIERPKPDLVAPGEQVIAPRTSRCADPGALTAQTLQEHGEAYMRVSGTSQATAVVSGVAACLLESARSMGLDLGDNPGRALRSILTTGALRVPGAGRHDYGSGIVDWPGALDILTACRERPEMRPSILAGSKLRSLA